MGGSSGGGGSQSSTSTVYTNADPWSGVQPYLKSLYSNTNTLGNRAMQYYPGQTYANMDPLQKAGIASNLGYAKNYFPQMFNQGVSGIYSQLNAPNVANNRYVQEMNQAAAQKYLQASGQGIRDMNRQFAQNVLPGIKSDAVSVGGFGGSRQGVAEGLAVQGLQQQQRDLQQSSLSDLATMYGQTNLGAYGQGLNAAGQAVSQIPQYAQLGLFPGQVYQQAGGIFGDMSQKQIDEAMARWDFQQNEPWQRLSNMNAIFSGATPYAAQSSSSTQQTPTPTSSPWANVAAAGAGAYGLYNMLG